MKNFKRIFSFVLVFLLMITFCGCNNSGEQEVIIEEEIVYESAGAGNDTTNNDNSGTESKTQTGTNSKNQTGTNSKNQTGTNSKNQTGTNSKTQTGTNSKNQTGTQNNTGSNKVAKTKTIKVLAIGHSYSNNSTRYIKEIADSTDGDTTVFAANLYFQACSIKQHNDNIHQWNYYFEKTKSLEETKKLYYSEDVGAKYEWLQVGNKQVNIKSLYEAIRYDDWDYITIQQTPDGCDDFSTFWTKENPHLITLYEYIQAEYKRDDMKGKKCPPILIHQTWAFNGDMAINNAYYYYPVNYASNTEMFKKVEQAYNLAAQKIKEVKGVDTPIIKSGEAVQNAQDKYGYSRKASKNLLDNTLYADEISHLNTRGSYLSACVWIETLAKLSGTTINTSTATFVPDEIGATLEDCKSLQYIAREVVHGKN